MLDIYTVTLIFKDEAGVEVGRIKASNVKADAYKQEMKSKGAVQVEYVGQNGRYTSSL